MRVLVVGTLPNETERLEARLTAAGHEVVRCHEPGRAPFPCVGLEDGKCPLDVAPVDVAVTAHERPWPRPSPFEDGAVCAIRRHLPLVVVGSLVHPFGRWASREVDSRDDVVAACEEAAEAPLREHSEVATGAVREVLGRAGIDPGDAGASVRHRRGRLQAMLTLPAVDHDVEARVSTAVIAALRSLDTQAVGIDVSVTCATS